VGLPVGGERLSAWVEEQAAPQPAERMRLEVNLVRALHEHDAAAALMLANVLVYADPAHDIARRIKERCAQQIATRCTLEFPKPNAVPRMLVPWSEIGSCALSRQEAFVLSCIDGRLTVEHVIDATAMPLLVAYEALEALVQRGIVELS
jgi:hypothetical protein